MERLEGQGLTSSANHSGLDLGRTNKAVAVGHGGQGAGRSSVRSTAKVVVLGHSIAIVSGVERLLAATKGVGLNQKLSTVAGVDSVADIQEVAVIDVTGAKAERRSARVDVVPVVVVLSDMEVAGVLGAVAVRVSNKRCLVMVVNEGVGNSDIVGRVGDLYSEYM